MLQWWLNPKLGSRNLEVDTGQVAQVAPAKLGNYRHGSFHWLGRHHHWDFMPRGECLRIVGMKNGKAGCRAYQASLAWLAADPAEQERQGWGALSKGWAIGSAPWRKSIRQEYRLKLGRHLFSREENARLNHDEWTQALEAVLARLNRTRRDVLDSAKGAAWKLLVVSELRRTTTATVPWLAQALHMGAASGLRALLARNKT